MQPSTPALITVSNVSKHYKQGFDSVAALQDVSLSINKGELLAIVGPSGSGKTTLIHIIGGLLTPDQGTIMVAGQELSQLSDRKLSKYRNQTVGFIFQHFSLLPGYTTLENVLMPLKVSGKKRKERKQQALQYLSVVGLGDYAKRTSEQLSGGERQRVSIARALVHQPQIIIADEPTGSLDSARGQEIMAILQTLAHQYSITVLMVTHDNNLAAQADRIINIKDGRVEGVYARP